MLEIAIPVQVVLQVGAPLLLAWFLIRRYGSDEVDHVRIFLGGAVSFGAGQGVFLGLSQLVGMVGAPDIPSRWQVGVSALIFGVGVGVLEEAARFAVLRFWLRDVRSWAQGLMLGCGHGGAESVLSGLAGLVWFVTMSSLRGGPPSGQDISEADKAHLQEVLSAYFSTPWQMPVLSAVQQVCLIALSLGLASLVMRVFLTGRLVYLPTAMLVHVAATTGIILAGQYGLGYGVLASAAAASVGLLLVRLTMPAPQVTVAGPSTGGGLSETAPSSRRPRRRRRKKS